MNDNAVVLKPLGRVREFSKIESDSSIIELRNRLDARQVELVKTYLSKGTGAMGWMEWLSDPISGESIGPHETFTDGIWLWRNDLTFLLDRYRIGLPKDFLSLVESKKTPEPVQMTRALIDVAIRAGW